MVIRSLPEVRPSSAVYGESDASIFGAAIKIAGDMVDEGVDFTLKPMRDQYGRLIARFTDSDGNEYEVIEMSGQR